MQVLPEITTDDIPTGSTAEKTLHRQGCSDFLTAGSYRSDEENVLNEEVRDGSICTGKASQKDGIENVIKKKIGSESMS